jgi:hypothetical protein
MRGANHLALQVRPNAAHNDFYFRKFWQLFCRLKSRVTFGHVNEDLALFHYH